MWNLFAGKTINRTISLFICLAILFLICGCEGKENREDFDSFAWGASQKSVLAQLTRWGIDVENDEVEHRIDYIKKKGFNFSDFDGRAGMYFGENDSLQRVAVYCYVHDIDKVDDLITALENYFGTPVEKIDSGIIMGIRNIQITWVRLETTISFQGVGSTFALVLTPND